MHSDFHLSFNLTTLEYIELHILSAHGCRMKRGIAQ